MRWFLCIALLLNSCNTSKTAPEDVPSIKVLSYNIHHARSASNADTQAEIENFLRDSKADFVFLQEVDRGTKRSLGRDQFALFQEKANYPYGHFEKTIDWDGGIFGIAILSRHPLQDIQIIPMEAPASEQGPEYERRVAIVARTTVSDRELILVNTHLHYESPARETMAQQLRDGLAPLIGESAMVFGGDFNILSSDPLLKTVSEGFIDTWTLLGLDTIRLGNFVIRKTIWPRIDYLFVRNVTKPLQAIVEGKHYSDHEPYWIEVPWP